MPVFLHFFFTYRIENILQLTEDRISISGKIGGSGIKVGHTVCKYMDSEL